VAVKLTDFGIGGVSAAHASTRSRIGTTTLDQLDAAEQATLFRGAGTALYMSPEQRRGEPADPRHDLFSLGVMWYQLLTGDVTRELHPGWSDELIEDHQTPPEHVEAIRACVGVMKKRPEHAGKLLDLLRHRPAPAAPAAIPVPVPAPPPAPVTARSAPILDAVAVEPKALDPVEAQKGREDLARAVVAAQQAARKDWRWGLMLAGILTGSITGAPFLVFTILTLCLPTGGREMQTTHFTFRTLIAVFGPISIGFTILAVLTGRSRLARQRATRKALADVIERTRPALSLSHVSYGPDDLESLSQAGWDLAREIEDRASLRRTEARIRFAGQWGFDPPVKVYLDGNYLGEGGRRRGFDLPARLSRGTHLLELHVHPVIGQPEIRQRAFAIGREESCRVEIGQLRNVPMKVTVVAYS
jgi:hypothetical protein